MLRRPPFLTQVAGRGLRHEDRGGDSTFLSQGLAGRPGTAGCRRCNRLHRGCLPEAGPEAVLQDIGCDLGRSSEQDIRRHRRYSFGTEARTHGPEHDRRPDRHSAADRRRRNRVCARRGAGPLAGGRTSDVVPQPPTVAPAPASAARQIEVRASMASVFYRSSSPDAPQFVALGDRVEAGQTLALLEAMKMMIPVCAEDSGSSCQHPRRERGDGRARRSAVRAGPGA